MQRKRIHFISKNKREIELKGNMSEGNNLSVKRFEVKKSKAYSETTNYFNEYWKMYYENEFILAKIKENAYEINAMKVHIEELNNLVKK
jgi:hypothetical protein